ncbi:hypothetical protein sos41_26150 [Alphaproteobacteria bacterium SO-S41]|nr:hypothetical protein sos41_26150 [Alphaproteobacteria bacterium SO-S41]
MAEVIQTEPSCAYPVEHRPDSDVAAGDLNGPLDLPPLELELRQYIPVEGRWFLDATLGAIRVDLQTGAVTGTNGRSLSASSTQTRCE